MTPTQIATAAAVTLGAVLAANLMTDEVRLWRVRSAVEGVLSPLQDVGERMQAKQLRDRFVFANRTTLRNAGIYIRSGAGDELPYYSPSVIKELGEKLQANYTFDFRLTTRSGLPVDEERLAEFGWVEPGEKELEKYRDVTLTLAIGGF
jgi:hypothetical protein